MNGLWTAKKKELSEIDICDLFITPAIKDAGWDQLKQIRREVTLTPGPIVVRGNMSSRNKKKKKFADYVLSQEPGIPIAVVEAKDNNHEASHGMQQALGYAEILKVPSVFSFNGDAFASHNKKPAAGEDIETEIPLQSFPSPAELWIRYKIFRGIKDKDEGLVAQPRPLRLGDLKQRNHDAGFSYRLYLWEWRVSIFGKLINLFKSQEEIDAIELKKAMARQKELDEFRRQKLHDVYVELRLENKRKSIKLKNELPIVKASKEIESALNYFKRELKQRKLKWEVEYENYSWWNKMKHLDGQDNSEIETRIKELEKVNANFKEKHGDSLSKLNDHLKYQFNLSKRRIEKAYDHALKVQPQYKTDILDGDDLIRKSFWFAILSVPVSASLDIINAHNVYDTLRGVNKNYLDMSDGEIWWATLWMAPEKLQGLASLTKGAYFEGLVAANTGGQLHEHFNHPGTDIVIDGVEMQIKATDSIDYINSVDADILVIATSEVALETGSIDGGYTNEELTDSVGLALGGSVVDIPDTFMDGILGGVGFFAIIKGFNHARIKYKKGGGDLESCLEGAGVAITQTAKTLVNTSELAYKAVKSRPGRFIGSNVWEGTKIIGKATIPTAKIAGKIAVPPAMIFGKVAISTTGFIWKIGKKLFGG